MINDEFYQIKSNLENEIKKLNNKAITYINYSKFNDFENFFLKIKNQVQLSFLNLNLLLLLKQNKKLITDFNYIAVRKNLNIALSFLAELVGRNFDSFYGENTFKKKLHNFLGFLETANLFKLIGMEIERLNKLLDFSSKLKSSVIELKEKYILIFINGMDFKKIIKNSNVENTDYEKYQQIIKIIKEQLETTAQDYWNLHMKDKRFKNNTLEIKKGILLLEILFKLNIITNEVEEKIRTRKKINSWKNYYTSLIKKNNISK